VISDALDKNKCHTLDQLAGNFDLLMFRRRRAMKIYRFTFKRVYSKCTYVIPSEWHITGRITVIPMANKYGGSIRACVLGVFSNDNDKFHFQGIPKRSVFGRSLLDESYQDLARR